MVVFMIERFLTSLHVCECGMHQVRAAAFLHKYSAPTLLVLYEDGPTWAGRLRDRKDTMRVSAMSIAASEQKLAEIWEAGELPSDAFSLLPVASGGVLILCRHLIIFQAQVDPPPPPPPPPLRSSTSCQTWPEGMPLLISFHFLVASGGALILCRHLIIFQAQANVPPPPPPPRARARAQVTRFAYRLQGSTGL